MDSVQEISSPVAFLRLISSSTGNISQELLSLNTVFHSDLSSIHGNISSVVSALNTLDDDIKGICFDDSGIIKAIKSLDIPSFDDSGLIASINGAAFDDSAILDAINNILK